MSELDVAKKHETDPAQSAVQEPTIISRRDERESPPDHQVLYVLGLGIAAAILSNMAVFLYFVSLHASG